MANRYYGLDLGDQANDVTEAASTTATTDIEVRVDLAGVTSGHEGKSQVLIALDNIKQWIIKGNWPPA
jgi:hypothetical protein